MRNSLKLGTKLFLCYLLTMILLIFGWSICGTKFFESKMKKNIKVTLYDEVVLIADNYLKGYYSNALSNSDLVTEIRLLASYLDARIIIARSDGNLLVDTEESYLVNFFAFENEILSQTFTPNGILPGYIDQPFLAVSYPITYNMQLRGYIVMLRYHDDIYREADALNTSYWPYILILGILISLTYLYLYFITVYPLRKLLHAAREYSNRNFNYTCKLRTDDEFNHLNNALICIGQDFNNLEIYQKKFIANVSHDFRSPLTSIRGYAEAIIDGTIPPELTEKYLNIILFETERLTKLTSSILELNNFDNKSIILTKSIFDINVVIKQAVASFEGTCKDKYIRIKLLFDEPQTYVEADMDKIQQVLYNLTDNAIKFSPQNSTIYITTKIKSDKVFTSVKDMGIGIPKESISKIWERFYKTDLSRGKDKKGTGLGLSITKEIITAHEEHINVISTVDVGTEFTFSLPRKSV